MKIEFDVVFDRRNRASTSSKGSVEIRFSYGRKQKYFSTGVKVFRNQFSVHTKKVVKCADSELMNNTIESYKVRASKIVNDMISSGNIVLDDIPRLMSGNTLANKDFISYCEERAANRKVSDNTKERYWVFIRFLRKFGKIKLFNDVTTANIRNMDEYLHREGKKESTIYDYHKFLKLFCNDACVDGLMEKNPYNRLPFKVSRGEKQYVDCLTQEQFNAIKELNIVTEHINQARDLFLMQCYTGLAYSDLMKFDASCCVQDAEGKYFYHSKRTKTDTDFVFQLLSPAVDILNRYKFKLPNLSNQKFNDYLKVIGAMIDVPYLHSHMGRATAATLFLSNGMPINVVAKVLGHTTIRQTQRYARTLNRDVKSAFDSLEGKI